MSDPAITAEAAAEGGRVLALRVLEQGILDATSAPIPRGRGRSQCRPLDDEQRDAVRFLTEPEGEWAAARAAWCDLAGVLPEWLARQMKQRTGRDRSTPPPSLPVRYGNVKPAERS